MEEKDYWIGFSVFSGVGSVTFQQLLTVFGSAKAAWRADKNDLLAVLKEKKTKDFLQFRQTFDFEKYRQRLKKTNVTVITLQDKQYPTLLKQIPKPPFVLYVRGNENILNNVIPDLIRDPKQSSTEMLKSPKGTAHFMAEQVQHDNKIFAIVGTRKVTQYGRDVTELFARELSNTGCSIVSGLAMGVDAVAHKTTIENGGKTIAVLGCGVDCCYPRENEALYGEILESGGAIISEVPLGMSATVGTFPARNRIVAGLSQGVLVTEGAEDSGALITAEFGIEYGRKVFAVPGPITSQLSKGPYKLIEKGAKLVTSPQDLLQEFQISNVKFPISNKKRIVGDTREEQAIIDLLQNESVSFDEIVRHLKIDSAKAGGLLSLMEVKGYIKTVENGNFEIVS